VDAKTAVSTAADKTMHWVVATGKPRQVPDGRKDFILGQKYKADTGPGEEVKPTTRVPTDSGEFLVSGIGGPTATLWRKGPTEKAAPRAVAHTPTQGSSVRLVTAAGDGKRLLTVTGDNAVQVWDTKAMTARPVPGFPWTPDAEVTAVALDADGRQVLLGGPGGELKLWRLP
jgi:WD40 repeat protein